jgi:DNA-binding transcriptional regulator YiaG
MDGKELRRIRARLQLSQSEFATLVAVTKNTVARWERDEQAIRPFVAKLIRIVATERKAK